MQAILLIILFFIFPPWVFANHFANISAHLVHFDYQEYLSSGAKFNDENGIIPGIAATYYYKTRAFGFVASLGYFNGNIDYNGQTQAGTTLVTSTNTIFTDISAEFSWYPVTPALGVYTQLQWHEWQRHILASRQSVELKEVYQWYNIEAGLISTLFEHNIHQIQFKFGLSHSKNGQLEIDLSKLGYGKPNITLADGSGMATSLSYHLAISDKSKLTIDLGHKQWKFSQSASKTIFGNGNALNIREPKSKSKRTNLVISYHFKIN